MSEERRAMGPKAYVFLDEARTFSAEELAEMSDPIDFTDPKINAAYEQGYRNGESSGTADWAIALGEVLPEDVDEWSPSAVVAYIEHLQERVGDE